MKSIGMKMERKTPREQCKKIGNQCKKIGVRCKKNRIDPNEVYALAALQVEERLKMVSRRRRLCYSAWMVVSIEVRQLVCIPSTGLAYDACTSRRLIASFDMVLGTYEQLNLVKK